MAAKKGGTGQDKAIKDASIRVGKALARSSFKAEEAARKLVKSATRKTAKPAATAAKPKPAGTPAPKLSAKSAKALKPGPGLTPAAQMGFVAGDIYEYLATHGQTSVDKIVRAMMRRKNTTAMVYCALGWLAREGKIIFTPDGDELTPA